MCLWCQLLFHSLALMAAGEILLQRFWRRLNYPLNSCLNNFLVRSSSASLFVELRSLVFRQNKWMFFIPSLPSPLKRLEEGFIKFLWLYIMILTRFLVGWGRVACLQVYGGIIRYGLDTALRYGRVII